MSTQLDHDGETAPVQHTRRQQSRLLFALIATVMLVAGTVGIVATRHDSTPAAPDGALSARTLEDRYGVRVDLVGLTALGGLLQLRFTVVDKDKAEAVFHGGETTPLLEVQPSKTLLHPPVDTAHKMTVLNGASYFLFYANAANVAHTGDKVSLVIQNVRVDGLTIAG